MLSSSPNSSKNILYSSYRATDISLFENILLLVVGKISDKTNPSNPLDFNTSETEMIKSLLEIDTLSGKIVFTDNNTIVEGFFFFKRATAAKVPEIKSTQLYYGHMDDKHY